MSSFSDAVQFVDEYEIKSDESIDSPVSSPHRLNSPPIIIRETAFAKRSGGMLPNSLLNKIEEQ